VQAAVRYIEQLRDQARDLPAEHPSFGLMPEAFGDGGLNGTRTEFTTALWTLAGLRYAAGGARLVGEPAEERLYRAAFDDLKRAFAASAAANRIPLPGSDLSYLPVSLPLERSHQFEPELAGEAVPRWRQIQPETASWALCQAIWPGEVFDPEDTVVTDLLALLDLRDDEQGIPATTGFLSYQAVWTYYASFAAHAWLFSGRPDKAIDYLYAFANHASPTRVWREEQSLVASANPQLCGDMPHNWASAEFIRLVRHLLVFERGEQLDLLPALPEHWLDDGAVTAVSGSPTRFGAIDLRVEARGGGVTVTVRRKVHPASQPLAAARLHLPPGLRVVGVDDAPVPEVSGHLALALPDGETTIVELKP
jgi:GH15 family glucan-1,4-alpha-glucosidase